LDDSMGSLILSLFRQLAATRGTGHNQSTGHAFPEQP